jgi:hypothetical protein
MEYLGAWGTLIHDKKLRSKISCQTPFKGTFHHKMGEGGPGFLTLWRRQLFDALQRRTSEDCGKIPVQDCSILFYTRRQCCGSMTFLGWIRIRIRIRGSMPLTNGYRSGSRRPKNMCIRRIRIRIRIRIRNTG